MQVMHLQFFLALRLEIQSAWNLLGQTVQLITTSSGMKSPRQTSHQSRWILITLYLMPHENERSIVFWLLLSPAPAPVVAAVIAVPAIAVVVFCKPSKSHYERSHGWPIKKKSGENSNPTFCTTQKTPEIVKKSNFWFGLSFHPRVLCNGWELYSNHRSSKRSFHPGYCVTVTSSTPIKPSRLHAAFTGFQIHSQASWSVTKMGGLKDKEDRYVAMEDPAGIDDDSFSRSYSKLDQTKGKSVCPLGVDFY